MYLALLLLAPLWQKKGRTLVSVMAIALGVALGYAVQLINRTAANEFGQALHTLSGEADLTVRGARAGFDEAVYPAIARLPEVALASPALEVDAHVAGRDDALRLLGLDAFRAGRLQPGLVGESGDRLDTLRSDAIFLSRSGAQALGLEPGPLMSRWDSTMSICVAGPLSDDATISACRDGYRGPVAFSPPRPAHAR
jgi:putative ABC transport system permease protein